MLKDDPNHILMNIIGLSHTSPEILKDGDILILPVVLITPKALRPIFQTNNRCQLGSHYHLLQGGQYNLYMTRTFSSRVQHSRLMFRVI